jgi:isoquinoline 1-oxidoreductase beta subunit
LTRVVKLSRRDVLKSLGIALPTLALGVYLPVRDGEAADDAGFAPNVFLTLDASATVTITITRVEQGQGIRTSIAMLMADEMAASWPRVVVKQADGDPRYGDQDTDASRSVRLVYRPLRIAAATARQMLEAAAAQQWRAAIQDCRAVDHKVIHVPTARVLDFDQLVKTAASLPIPNPDRLRLEDISSRRYIGHAVPSLDQPGMIHGKTVYGADAMSSGLKYASIERCPVYGGKAKSFDASEAMNVRGVEKVIEMPAPPPPTGHLPLGGIAVIASNSWAAIEGRKKLKIEWDPGPNAAHDSAVHRAELEAAIRKQGKTVRVQGNFDAAYSNAAIKLTGEYFVPYQAHATIEPPTALAIYDGGKLAVVAPTQNPQGARTVLAQFLEMRDTDVAVRPTFAGNGFGRKSMHDFVLEAGWLAKAINGKVRVIWTREDDIRHDYYHPICAQRIDGGLDKNGLPIAWRHRTVFPSLNATFHADQLLPDAAQLVGVTDMPYAIANLRCEVAAPPPHVRLGPHRGGLSLSHAFAQCSFLDEMAQAAGKDTANFLFQNFAGPRKIDLKSLGVEYANYGAPIDEFPLDVGRLQNVLQFAMDRSGWGEPLLPHQGRGIAVHRSFLSYAAAVIVVTVEPDGKITVPRVDLVIDCGEVINPDRVKALMEDSIMHGLSFALFGGVSVRNGAIVESNLDSVRLVRANLAPEMHIQIIPSTQQPSGAGDPAVPVIAPALCNAIFAATGKRIRVLPIDVDVLKDTPGSPNTAAVPLAPLPGVNTPVSTGQPKN